MCIVTNSERSMRPIFPFLLLSLMLIVTGCASRKAHDGPPKTGSAVPRHLPPDAIPKNEPRSRYGNPATYEVFGVSYSVLRSSDGFKERGVASWYGNKFHGRPTSSQEPYNMYAMTAAHKTLPLPTYIHVRNLRNNKTVVVRVNDRGPFVDNRIIDLSYAAAIKLDMIKTGTSLVAITALGVDQPEPEKPRDVPTRAVQSIPDNPHDVFLQVGAFGDVENAKRRFRLLRDRGIDNAYVHKDRSQQPALYRIRIGPIGAVRDYDTLVSKLRQMGITDSHLITD